MYKYNKPVYEHIQCQAHCPPKKENSLYTECWQSSGQSSKWKKASVTCQPRGISLVFYIIKMLWPSNYHSSITICKYRLKSNHSDPRLGGKDSENRLCDRSVWQHFIQGRISFNLKLTLWCRYILSLLFSLSLHSCVWLFVTRVLRLARLPCAKSKTYSNSCPSNCDAI